jgi:hypothetical protein
VSHESVAEGWYEDPFEIHEYRWFSAGRPTGLVKDGRTEATDPPPDTEVAGPLVPEHCDTGSGANRGDLRRADEAEAEDGGSNQPADPVWDVMPQAFPLE